jgi:hypothetical protein
VTRRDWRRSGRWQAVFLGACLAMTSYIAFDILDLDGSGQRDTFAGSVITTETASSETERVLPHFPANPEALNLVPLSLGLRSVPDIPQLFTRLRPATFGPRLTRLRPRARVAREASSSIIPPSADPA